MSYATSKVIRQLAGTRKRRHVITSRTQAVTVGPTNTALATHALHSYLRWRNANARYPDVLAAQRREHARIRSEKGVRWGGRPLMLAA